MVAAQGLTLPNSPPTKKTPRPSQGVFFKWLFSSVVFVIGNWRWSTCGPFRETSQELVPCRPMVAAPVLTKTASVFVFPVPPDCRKSRNRTLYLG